MEPLRPSSWYVAAGLFVASMTAVAQPLPEEKLEADREVVVTGEPGEQPAMVYGAANIGVQLVFDAPLQRTDAGIGLKLAGGDVRLHPYLNNALVLIPSRALAGGPAVPLYVTLVDGGVPLLLTFHTGRVDHVIHILQRPVTRDAGTAVSRAAFQEALSSTASAIFKDGACAMLRSQLVRTRPVNQMKKKRADPGVLVCATGTLNYLRVPREHPECAVSSARLSRQGKDVEVLLLESVRSEKEFWQVLAVWSPPEKAEDFELLLLAADGTLCEGHYDLMLGPGGSP